MTAATDPQPGLTSADLEDLARQGDREILSRARSGYFVQWIVIVALSALDFYHDFPRAAACFITLSMLACLIRVMLHRFGREWIEAAPRRFRAWFAATTLFAAAIWTAFICFVLGVYTFNDPTAWIVLLCASGLAAGATTIYSPWRFLLWAEIALLDVPIAVTLLVLGNRVSLTLAIAAIIQFLFHIVAGQKLYDSFWSALRTNALLRMQQRTNARLAATVAVSERMASLGTLAAGVGHEINNPLSFVVANLDFAVNQLSALQRATEGLTLPSAISDRVVELPEVITALGEAGEGALRIRNIVRDLKAFSIPDQTQAAQVDLDRVIDLAVAMTNHEIRHRCQLTKDLGVIPPFISSASRIGQVLVNLLVNAAQAIAEGDMHHNTICMRTRSESGQVIIEVSDTGSGIAPEVLARVFDPFFTTKTVRQGTGLGLSICRSIVTSLGGEISLHSQEHKGTTVRVALPLMPRRQA